MAENNVLNFLPELSGKIDPAAIARALSTPVRLKTWSLIVTFFGDAVLPRGGSISAISLGQVMEAIGIEAGAVRTAVSRLASDGWIEREREGRASFYRLAPYREQAFAKAAEVIYGRPDETIEPGEWALGSLPGDIVFEPRHEAFALPLQKGWYLLDLSRIDRRQLPAALMIFEGKFLQKPAWFSELLAPQELAVAMERLIDVFQPVLAAVDCSWKPSPLEALTLRCLLIHEWRRIALRLHKLPKDLVPEDWPETRCRFLVAELYRKLFDTSEIWLDLEAVSLRGSLPKADRKMLQRFL